VNVAVYFAQILANISALGMQLHPLHPHAVHLWLQYIQWWHSKVLETGCFVRKMFKPRIWNIQAATYSFLGMYPAVM